MTEGKSVQKRVLIVDDEPDVLRVLEARLASLGYVVHKASTGLLAIRLAREVKPNLIILDVVMPGVDGCEVAETLRDDPATQNIPIMFLTALKTKEEEKVMGQSLGGNVIMAKPFETEEFLRQVRDLIG